MNKSISTSILIAAIAFSSSTVNAQITLEHTFNNVQHAWLINLSASGEKIVTYDDSTIRLYNPDYSLWKTIQIPQYNNYNLGDFSPLSGLLSEDLFDNNPNTIEYLVYYFSPTTQSDKTEIIREDGTILKIFDGGVPRWDELPNIFKGTDEKFELPISFDNSVKIYSLPGIFPCQPSYCEENSTGMKPISFEQSGGLFSNPIPNPSSISVNISYRLPHASTSAMLQIFDAEGKLIHTQLLKSSQGTITVNVSGFTAGTYFYQIKTPLGNSSAKKMLVIK